MTDSTDAAERELRPATRYEWEQVVLRARLAGVIGGTGRTGKNGRATRGGVSGTTCKAVIMVISAHADPDGTRIWPGDATVAVLAETSVQVVQSVRRVLVQLGLLDRVRARSRRQHRGDEYRLTLPTDLLDRLEVLTPAAVKAAAMALYDRRRGKRGGSGGSPTDTPDPDGVGDPVDPPCDDESGPMGDPVDPPQAEPDESCGGSGGTTTDACGGSGGTHVGDPVARDTKPLDPPQLLPSPTDADVRTAVTGPRASDVDEPDPMSAEGGVSDPPPAAEPSRPPTPARCTPHGLAGGVRGDGRPACPLCRVEQDQAAGRRRPPPATTPNNVIPIRRSA